MSTVKRRKKILRLEGESGYTIREEETPVPLPKSGLGLALEVSEIGFSIALPIVAGAFFGLWLDGKFGSHPRATLSGIATGILLAFGNLFWIVRKYSKKEHM